MPLVHKISELYSKLYLLGKTLPKRDHFGIYLKIENVCLELLELSITAAFEAKINKSVLLSSARIKTEVLKNLVRKSLELKIIERKKYIEIQTELQEISKMINGWLKFLK